MKMELNGRYFRCFTKNCMPPSYDYEKLVLDLDKTALLLVDVYSDPGCGKAPEHAPDEGAEMWWEVIENISHVLKAARSISMPIIYVANSSPKIELARSSFGRHFKRGWGGDFDSAFVEGSVDNMEFHGNSEMTKLKYPKCVQPLPGEYYLRKHVYSGFFDSRLDTLLRNKGITTLIAVGFWADVCLLATSLDALYRNYDVVWIRGCTMAGGDPSNEGEWENTNKYTKLFEKIIGYTVGKNEFIDECNKVIEYNQRV